MEPKDLGLEPSLSYEEMIRRIARRLIHLNKVLGDPQRREKMSPHQRRICAEELEAIEAALPMLRLVEQARSGEWK